MAINPNALTGFMDGFTQAIQITRQSQLDKENREDKLYQRRRQYDQDQLDKQRFDQQTEMFGLQKRKAEGELEKFEYENSPEARARKEKKERLDMDVLQSQLTRNNIDIDIKNLEISTARKIKDKVNKLTAIRDRRPLVEEIVNDQSLGEQFDNLVALGRGKINPNVDPRTLVPIFSRFAKPEVEKALGQKAKSDSWAIGKGEGDIKVQEGAELVGLEISDVRTNKERRTAALLMTAQWRNPDGTVAVVPNTLATKDREGRLDDNILEVKFENVGTWTNDLAMSVSGLSKMSPEERANAFLSGEEALMNEIRTLSGGTQTGETIGQRSEREMRENASRRTGSVVGKDGKPMSEKEREELLFKYTKELAEMTPFGMTEEEKAEVVKSPTYQTYLKKIGELSGNTTKAEVVPDLRYVPGKGFVPVGAQ